MRRLLVLLGLVAGFVALGAPSCNTEKLLSVSVEDEPTGSPPNFTQEVGHIQVGDFGIVRVADSPDPSGPGGPGKWIQIMQVDRLPPAKLTGLLTAVRGPGRYLFTFQLFIPFRNVASVTLNSGGSLSPGSFLGLTFLEGGSVELPGPTRFGEFPHDKAFSVSVSLDVGATTTATITLLGVAHGSATITLGPLASTDAASFASVQFLSDASTAGSTYFTKSLTVIRSGP